MTSNEISTINRGNIQVRDEDEEEEDGDEDEEENSFPGTLSRTILGKADIQNCKENHFGTRSEYHGSVNVKNLYKITVPPPPIGSLVPQRALTAGNPLGLALPFNPRSGPSFLGEENNFSFSATEISTSRNQVLENIDADPNPNAAIINAGNSSDISEEIPLLEENGTNTEVPFSKRVFQVFCSVTMGLLLGMMTLTFLLLLAYAFTKVFSPPDDDDPLPNNFTARLITRGKWFATPPKHDLQPFQYNPPPFVIVCHTAGVTCFDKHSCRIVVKNIQAGQMQGVFDDISYNYLVGGDGYIYEGRGWEHACAAAHVMDCSALSVAFIGNFIVDEPPQKQIDAFKLILNEGVSNGTLDKNYKMFMQKQVINTESPGEALIEILMKWPHWKPFGKQDLICNKSLYNW